MDDIPRRAVSRTARLAGLPIGFAGRAAVGLGKRVTGLASEVFSTDVQQRTAEHLFRVLGELKGGAMKVGQALSVFEAALPEDLAGPYRQALGKLQEAAPPMPVSTVHNVLRDQLGAEWRDQLVEFDDEPAAAASIGQVHRAVWRDQDGRTRPVAVKVQYPGAGDALLSDLGQLSRFSGLFRTLQPGVDVKALISELRDRVTEELDYRLEADNQRAFAEAYADDAEIVVPQVVAASDRVLVTEWMEGTGLGTVISEGSQAERDRAGALLATLNFSAPQRTGLLHADPHPGNFRMLADGRLGVIDFGAVARLPGGHPEPIGRLARLALAGDAKAVFAGLREEGFIKPDLDVDPQEILEFVVPMLEPIRSEEFQFTRAWLREEAGRVGSPRGSAYSLGRQLSLPPSYLLIYRVTLGSIGVLCQLEARAQYREILLRWLPGFADPADAADELPEGIGGHP